MSRPTSSFGPERRQGREALDPMTTDTPDGTWSPKWSTWEDQPTSAEDLRDVILTFRDGRCEVRRGGTLIRRGTYSADPTRSPKTLESASRRVTCLS